MAAYTCRLYTNTGFNTINIPDSPALLNSMSYVDVPALDINQERFLSSVRVRATWAQVKDADYCKVGDFFYCVKDIFMSSVDVAEISLVPDFITSAGGPADLEILDGLTSRVCVADDSFGIYSADDPFMAPAYDMDIASYQVITAAASTTFVETTLSLDTLGNNIDADSFEAFTAYDPHDSTGELKVVVPKAEYLKASTTYKATIGSASVDLKNVQNQGLYIMSDADANKVAKGIEAARSLGIEDSISGQFSIPNTMITVSSLGGFVTNITGQTDDLGIMGLPFIYGTANNNRVWYGSQSKYTLVSAAGNTLSANAEEIYSTGATAPTVRRIVDPRRTGKPFYRFMPLNGNNGDYDFFRGAVAGRPWDSVPMVLSQKSGGLLDRVNYDASVARHDLSDTWAGYDAALGVLAGGVKMTAGAGGAIASAIRGGDISKGVSDAAQGAIDIATSIYNVHRSDAFSRQERNLEKQQFQISQSVNVPDIKFALDPDLMGEALHNGFMVFRTKYKAADISRIDKILTAFGYKFTKVLEASDFTNRTKFNYVEGSISVGNLPRWWADGVASQVASGIRVWHIKPTHTAYSSNPIA